MYKYVEQEIPVFEMQQSDHSASGMQRLPGYRPCSDSFDEECRPQSPALSAPVSSESTEIPLWAGESTSATLALGVPGTEGTLQVSFQTFKKLDYYFEWHSSEFLKKRCLSRKIPLRLPPSPRCARARCLERETELLDVTFNV
jgi:hypothetical protein